MRKCHIVVLLISLFLFQMLSMMPVPAVPLKYDNDAIVSIVDSSFMYEFTGDNAGYSVAMVGDVNRDGFDDILVGAKDFDGPGANSGKVYLMLGQAARWPKGLNLSNANASWIGEYGGDVAGASVAGAGDVNGDGYDDMLVGACLNNEAGTTSGQAYLIFGRASGWATNVSLKNVNASFRGETINALAGNVVSGVGDVNGDGFDDFLISANIMHSSGNSLGKVYLFLGRTDGWAMDSDIGAASNASFFGEVNYDYLASSVAGAGDVNGDGYDDMLMGTEKNAENGYYAGEAYLILGKASGWAKGQNISSVADASFLGAGVNDSAGRAVDGAGDVNGDGYDDIIIGADYNADVAFRSGKAYIIYGKASGWAKDQDLGVIANASFRGETLGDRAGAAVAMAGDVNGDGSDDMLIGSPYYGNTDEGKAYLMLGSQSGLSTNVSLLNAMASFKGETGLMWFTGASLDGGGDVDGDGYDDILIGAPAYNSSSGAVFLANLIDGTPPTTVNAVFIYNQSYTRVLNVADVGDTVGIELRGTNEDIYKADGAYVWVNSSSDPNGFKMRLRESTDTSGSYRNFLTFTNITNPRDGWIRAQMGDKITVTSMTNKSKYYNITIQQYAQLLMPKLDNKNATEDVTYMVAYSNAGSNPVSSWTFDTNASWLTLDTMGPYKVLVGTPNNTNVGSCWVRINITDGLGNFAEHNFTLKVANTPPNITTNDTVVTVQSQPYWVDYNSTDDGQGNVTWHLATNASWLKMNATTGILNGTPSWNQTGQFWVNLSVSDGNGGWCSQSFNLTVTNVNDPPIILNDDVLVAYEDARYHVVYSAIEPDPGDMVTWLFSSNASWLNFDYSNRWLDGTPTNDQVGDYWVNVTAKDLLNSMTVRNFTLEVVNVNDPPEFKSEPQIIAQVLYEYRYQVVATDIDKGDMLNYSLPSSPANMSIGNVTGLITWKPTRSQAGDHHIIVNVSDGNATVQQEFTLTVTIPPYFIPVTTLLFPENGTIVDVKNPVLGWSAEDPDGDNIFYNVYLGTERDQVTSLDTSVLVAYDISQGVFVPTLPLGRGNTYYWTVMPNDGSHGGRCSSGTWQFTVSLAAGMSTEPLSFLISPGNMSELAIVPVSLSWTGMSFRNSTLSYDVYVGSDQHLVKMNDISTRVAKGSLNETMIFEGAALNTTYYWTTVPKDGSSAGKCLNDVWSFTISPTAKQNHWPVITSIPSGTAFVNDTYSYQVNATDSDGDTLIFVLAMFPDGMVIDPWTGLVFWSPNVSQLGDNEVLIWVVDDFLTTEQLFTVTVLPKVVPNKLPVVTTVPETKAYVGQEYTYSILATDQDAGDTLTYSLERGPSGAVFDPVTRKLTWTPDADQVGTVQFSIKVWDGKGAGYQNFTVTVEEVGGRKQSSMLPFLLIGISVLAITFGTIGAAYMFGRRRGSEKKRKKEKEEEEERERRMAARVDAARASGMEEGAAAATAAHRTKAGAAVRPEDDDVEPFEINDVFLIYKDGRLLAHSMTRDTESLDKDLMSSMLVAIQSFVEESFQDGLTSFECSNKKIVLVAGNHLFLVAVVDGTEPKVLRDEMQSIISKIEGLYSGIVEEWDGNTGHFKDVKPYMLPLFRLQQQLRIRKTKDAVKVKSGIEFFGGFVRLKVGVSNGLEDPITLVALALTFDTISLRLSHIEPEYPMQGTKIFLNDIKPKEKRTVAVYFDPVICQESSIEGVVTFFDASGAKGSAVMKTRPVDIVCPIFYTKENINVAMLKRLIKELKYNDTKAYQVEEVENLKVAYKVAKDCVQAHDVKTVREYGVDSPYETEMWYYGEVKGSDEQIVICVAAREWQHSLSIFVASRNLASMTGLLAEIGKDFGRAMDEWTLKGVMSSLMDDNMKGEIARTLSLLEKEKEAEAHPAESESQGPGEAGQGDPPSE